MGEHTFRATGPCDHCLSLFGFTGDGCLRAPLPETSRPWTLDDVVFWLGIGVLVGLVWLEVSR